MARKKEDTRVLTQYEIARIGKNEATFAYLLQVKAIREEEIRLGQEYMKAIGRREEQIRRGIRLVLKRLRCEEGKISNLRSLASPDEKIIEYTIKIDNTPENSFFFQKFIRAASSIFMDDGFEFSKFPAFLDENGDIYIYLFDEVNDLILFSMLAEEL